MVVVMRASGRKTVEGCRGRVTIRSCSGGGLGRLGVRNRLRKIAVFSSWRARTLGRTGGKHSAATTSVRGKNTIAEETTEMTVAADHWNTRTSGSNWSACRSAAAYTAAAISVKDSPALLTPPRRDPRAVLHTAATAAATTAENTENVPATATNGRPRRRGNAEVTGAFLSELVPRRKPKRGKINRHFGVHFEHNEETRNRPSLNLVSYVILIKHWYLYLV